MTDTPTDRRRITVAVTEQDQVVLHPEDNDRLVVTGKSQVEGAR